MSPEDFKPEMLKAMRHELGYSLTEMARRVGMSRRGYVHWERGDRLVSPSGKVLLTIMKAIGHDAIEQIWKEVGVL